MSRKPPSVALTREVQPPSVATALLALLLAIPLLFVMYLRLVNRRPGDDA